MKASQVIVAIFGSMFNVFVTVALVVVVYRGAAYGYDYGYRVFTEKPMTSGEGRAVMFTVTEDMTFEEEETSSGLVGLSPGALIDAFHTGRKMGETLEKDGLIRDRNLFVLQFILSEYRIDLKPGVYELNTSMTVEEMLEVMTDPGSEDGDSGDGGTK